MKKTLLTIACAAVFCSCNAQHSLTIKLSDVQGSEATVSVIDKSMRNMEKSDKVAIVNGEVTYDFTGDKARMVMIQFQAADGHPARLQAYLVPGEQGTLTGSLKSAQWSGSKFYSELAELEKVTDPIQNEMSAIGAEFQQKVQAGANRDSLQAVIMPKYQALADKLTAVNTEYIKNHPNSNVSVTLLNEVEDQEAAMALLSNEVKTGVFSDIVDAVQKAIDQEKARKEAAKAVADGCMAPEITLNDLNGKPFSLSSLRGKYVILDFWGSWCGWCIKGFPEMKKAYDKYKSKLEILGVDCNDTEQKWKDAVAKHELPWKHVYNPRTSDVCTTYAIQGYPTKIIIDPQGKIVKTIVGEDPEFYTFLDELMK